VPQRRSVPASFVPVLLALVVVASAGLAAQAERAPAATRPVATAPATTPVLSARRVPTMLAAPVAANRLAARLADFAGRSPGHTCIDVQADGVSLFAQDDGAPMMPASLEKLVTAEAALDALGRDTRLTTHVRAPAAPEGGHVPALYLVGGGDPLLMTADYLGALRNPPPEHSSFEALADQVVAAGVKVVDNGIIGDESRYDTARYNPTWPSIIATEVDIGPMTALTVNGGLDQFPPAPDLHRPPPHGSDQPALTAADRFADLLRARGVTVNGGSSVGGTPPDAVEITHLDSAPVADLINEMLRESDNTTAELLTKEMGLRARGAGTTEAGLSVINDWAAHHNLALPGTGRVDGSGLSTDDKVTCSLVEQLLTTSGPAGPLGTGMPVAGQSGTLLKRFLDTPVVGRLRAKTGTLDHVTALAGYLPTAKGSTVTFTYILNLGPRVTLDDIALQDELVTILDSYPDAPILAALGPK